jgi:hypothetical protein
MFAKPQMLCVLVQELEQRLEVTTFLDESEKMPT